jgi:hypothetical protein
MAVLTVAAMINAITRGDKSDMEEISTPPIMTPYMATYDSTGVNEHIVSKSASPSHCSEVFITIWTMSAAAKISIKKKSRKYLRLDAICKIVYISVARLELCYEKSSSTPKISKC